MRHSCSENTLCQAVLKNPTSFFFCLSDQGRRQAGGQQSSLSVVGNECRHFSSLFLPLLFQLGLQSSGCLSAWWIVAVQFEARRALV